MTGFVASPPTHAPAAPGRFVTVVSRKHGAGGGMLLARAGHQAFQSKIEEARPRPPPTHIRVPSPGRPGPKEGRGMAWLSLLLAGLLEIVWVYFMKQSQGFTKAGPTIITIITMIGSF